jgi:hypothetical protein
MQDPNDGRSRLQSGRTGRPERRGRKGVIDAGEEMRKFHQVLMLPIKEIELGERKRVGEFASWRFNVWEDKGVSWTLA